MSLLRRSNCPISQSLELFGDKWTLLVMRDIVLFDKRTFGEMAKQESIASNILADRLDKLLDAGLLRKGINPANKSSNLYTLTEEGLSLIPVLLEILLWGSQYFDISSMPDPNILSDYAENKETACNELIENLRVKHLI